MKELLETVKEEVGEMSAVALSTRSTTISADNDRQISHMLNIYKTVL